MKITEMSSENRPRERLEKEGPRVLSTAELLAIILKSGTKKENILEICNKLLSKYGLEKLSSCTLQELQEEYGIGKAKACQIVALFELSKKICTIKKDDLVVKKAGDIAEIYTLKLGHLKKENFVSVYLDTKNRIISEETTSVGILNASLIHPREVFHGAIKSLANSVIVLHNHPSGDPCPSKEDLEITKRLVETGKILGIELLDHIIIGKDSWWSWQEGKVSQNQHNF
ncbi:MAG: DNA repair protein RadC [Nanoarchaeota archaeon]|nr:DNA repair protein RadC [Nanoarchaeota archaeon]MBU1631622.1 DNA repair protein RadC [Nanoarchaeota archaeon]MBU1876625.1 DNA repair protein RadC [Nanoarchaeota archaeon]